MTKKRIHVTGASGFVGSNLCKILKDKYLMEGSGRSYCPSTGMTRYFSHDWHQPLNGNGGGLTGVYAVIHCAGLAHEVSSRSNYSDYFNSNVDTTVNVFTEAVRCGVKKFIFISSLAVYGMSGDVVIIDDKSAPLPISSYGKTKFTAEQKLLKMALGSKVELVIIRPPMIIGRGAPGNLDRLMRLLRSPIPFPLPIGNVHRSFITIESLARFCDCVLDKKHSLEPLIANLASTPTVTLSELVKSLRLGLGVRMINIVFPKFILAWAMRILGLSETYQKVFSSLLIKPSSAAIDMGWSPHEDWRAVFIKIGEDAKSDERRNKIRNE